MVNFSNMNLAARNEEFIKIKEQNLAVSNDIRLTGLAKLFVADYFKIYIASDGIKSIKKEDLQHYSLYSFSQNDNSVFMSKVRDEFKILGYIFNATRLLRYDHIQIEKI